MLAVEHLVIIGVENRTMPLHGTVGTMRPSGADVATLPNEYGAITSSTLL